MRYNPNYKNGLNKEQVSERVASGLINDTKINNSKSIKKIIVDNFFTLFNVLNVCLGIIVFIIGAYKNLFFLGVIIFNTLISTLQEIKAKKIIDKLSLLSSPKAKVIRDSQEITLNDKEIVLDDIILLERGNQVLVDAIIIKGDVETNEAFVTGEEETVYKKSGDLLLSGSFIISGECYVKVEHIKEDNFVTSMALGAKYIKQVNSTLLNAFNKILKIISLIIIPLGVALFLKEYLIGGEINEAILKATAALISMIPSGLILLTSSIMAIGIIRLSKSNVLIQRLYSFETLSRVDVVAFDKTGTITEGKMEVVKEIVYGNNYHFKEIMATICASSKDNNPTMQAVKEKYNSFPPFKCQKVVPFSSERKYASYQINNNTYKMGSEVILKEDIDVKKYYRSYRVIFVTENDKLFGLILLQDKIRESIKNIFKYFKDNKLKIKIISGDNSLTVNGIMRRLGYKNLKWIDMTNVQIKDIKSLVNKYDIFGRVTPIQKKELINSIKTKGKKVAYVGDGVNDVLALKEADVSISFASGSDAAKKVAEIVLLDSDFNSVPLIINEGRKTISNIERSASLFLSKTGYALLLTIAFIVIPYNYPFIPIQLTLIGVLTIGIPSFILGLEGNGKKSSDSFLFKIIKQALPGSLTIAFNILLLNLGRIIFGLDSNLYTTLAVIITGIAGFTLLFHISKPFNKNRLILFITMITLFTLAIFHFNNLFSLIILGLKEWLIILIGLVFTVASFKLFSLVINHFAGKYIAKKR